MKIAAAAVLGLSMTACSKPANNGGGSSSGGNTAAPEQTAETTAAELTITASDKLSTTSAVKDSLTIGYTALWESLTPFRSNANNKMLYSYTLYETLAKKTAEGEYIPWTAKSWTMHDDGITYDVELYDNINDSKGNNIKAEDVVAYLNESAVRGLKPCFTKIDKVEATGDYTFTVTLKADVVGTWEKILTDTFVFSWKELEESGDEFATKPVTTSPYVVTDYTPQATLTLELRDDYWNKDAVAINKSNVKKVTFQQIAEASQAGIALEKGVVDAFIGVDANTLKQFEGNDNFVIHKGLSSNGMQLYFSGIEDKIIQQDVHLRRALAYIVNSEAIIQAVYGGNASLMYDVNPEVNEGYLPEWKNEEYFPYDVEKAKAELAESSYNGEELLLTTTSGAATSRMAQMIQNNALEIGINIKLDIKDQAAFAAQRFDGNTYDLIIISNGADSVTNFWSTRFDSTTYKLGDATSRQDQVLTDMIHEASEHTGYTKDNINKVRNYINDNMYGYGICHPQTSDVFRSDIGIKEFAETSFGIIDFISSVY